MSQLRKQRRFQLRNLSREREQRREEKGYVPGHLTVEEQQEILEEADELWRRRGYTVDKVRNIIWKKKNA